MAAGWLEQEWMYQLAARYSLLSGLRLLPPHLRHGSDFLAEAKFSRATCRFCTATDKRLSVAPRAPLVLVNDVIAAFTASSAERDDACALAASVSEKFS